MFGAFNLCTFPTMSGRCRAVLLFYHLVLDVLARSPGTAPKTNGLGLSSERFWRMRCQTYGDPSPATTTTTKQKHIKRMTSGARAHGF